MIQHPGASDSDEIPDETRRALVNSLFADARSMVVGSIATLFSQIVVAYVIQSWIAASISVGTVVITANARQMYCR